MNLIYSFRVIATLRDPVTHLQGYAHKSTEWAQRVSILHMDGQIPLLINPINLSHPDTQDTLL